MTSPDIDGMHHALVDDLVRRRLLTSPAVEAAFRAVPRHPFLPGVPLETIYSDEPVVTHYNADKQPISSSSQPAIMAIMLEMLALEPGQRVLEIGVGTGYNAALIRHIVGEGGSVTSVDIDPDVITGANAHLRAAAISGVRLILGDGALGCEAYSPYDRIILTVGAYDIALAWRDQLFEGGLLVLPLSLRAAPRVFSFRRKGDMLRGVDATVGGFMPLRGIGAPQEETQTLPRTGGVLWSDAQVPLDIEALDQLLSGAYHDLPTGVTGTLHSTWSGYALWLELHTPEFVHAPLRGERDGKPKLTQTCGIARDGQVALVVGERGDDRHGLRVRQFNDERAIAERLIGLLRDWQSAGSPTFEEDVQVDAYSSDMAIKAAPGTLRVAKPNMQYLLSFRNTYV